MATNYPFKIKGTYSFNTYAPQILGSDFENVTVLSIMDHETAIAFMDIASLHVNVYPYLPSGYPDDLTATDYIKIRTSGGNDTIIGVNWIVEETIVELLTGNIYATISGVSATDINRVINALASNGFNSTDVRFVSSLLPP